MGHFHWGKGPQKFLGIFFLLPLKALESPYPSTTSSKEFLQNKSVQKKKISPSLKVTQFAHFTQFCTFAQVCTFYTILYFCTSLNILLKFAHLFCAFFLHKFAYFASNFSPMSWSSAASLLLEFAPASTTSPLTRLEENYLLIIAQDNWNQLISYYNTAQENMTQKIPLKV